MWHRPWAHWEEGIYVIYLTEEGELLPIDPEEREAELRRRPSEEENEDPEEGTFIAEEGERWIRTYCRCILP